MVGAVYAVDKSFWALLKPDCQKMTCEKACAKAVDDRVKSV